MYKLTEEELHEFGHIAELERLCFHMRNHLVSDILESYDADPSGTFRFWTNEDDEVFLIKVEEHNHANS